MDMLTKSLRRGRLEAVNLLDRLSKAAGLPVPHYQYESSGYTKKPSHFYKVRFRVPEFISDEMKDWAGSSVTGAGRCKSKKSAKSLAALEAVHRLEEALELPYGSLKKKVDELEAKQKQQQEEIENTPIETEIKGVSWENIPIDPSFAETNPAKRLGRIEFFPDVRDNYEAFMAAKFITLRAQENLPTFEHHSNMTDDSGVQRWANLRTYCPHDGRVISGPTDEDAMSITNRKAEIRVLREKVYNRVLTFGWSEDPPSSFGMAKIFARLPKHQYQELKELLSQVDITTDKPSSSTKNGHTRTERINQRRQVQDDDLDQQQQQLRHRRRTLEEHQQRVPLPVDTIQHNIPHNAEVTIVRGGTGSGKTTRYPLMLSLFSDDPNTKVLVAQPRRIACQMAANRVALEQEEKIGSKTSPIGYSIRFESFPAKARQRTVDFQTPGIILRKAMYDPLLLDFTHLVLDEIHERNADMDLLVALAKEAQKQRAANDNLPNLKVILMSATLDSSQWISYFSDATDFNSDSVALVDVPDMRRFPIDIFHLGDKEFPSTKSLNQLLRYGKKEGRRYDDMDDSYDDLLCTATAELAVSIINRRDLSNGSILCFLPGMDEIRLVDRLIRRYSKGKPPVVRYLHSSLSSREQAKAFEPGRKIILSTNIAETSGKSR